MKRGGEGREGEGRERETEQGRDGGRGGGGALRSAFVCMRRRDVPTAAHLQLRDEICVMSFFFNYFIFPNNNNKREQPQPPSPYTHTRNKVLLDCLAGGEHSLMRED